MTIKEYFEKRLATAKISDDWKESFYHLASALLDDVATASNYDDLIAANQATTVHLRESKSALRRISKIIDVLNTRMSPSLERGMEIHAIMDQLRYVTIASNHDNYEVVEDSPDKFECVVTEPEPSDTVEMMQEPELDDTHPLAEAAREYYRHLRQDEYLGCLCEEAEKHWTPQATLQSLAVNIYLDRHGHIEEGDRTRWRETLRRDLRFMRRANLSVTALDKRECKDTAENCTPVENQS